MDKLSVFLAPDTKVVGLSVVVANHTRVIVVQAPVPCVVGTIGTTRPKVRVRAVIVRSTTVHVACEKRIEYLLLLRVNPAVGY
jgi:hypothetical protein